tara:strand:+ start:160 stop:948 length:789 start_codon:yes stop_codon:yes gene_type:complete
MTNNPSFSSWPIQNGLLYDYSKNEYPTKLYSWNKTAITFSATASTLITKNMPLVVTYYGYVFKGDSKLSLINNTYNLKTGMYFSCTEKFTISGGSGILIKRIGEKSMFMIGGPIEREGRLNYIDGCTDSLLVPPTLLGNACLNHLHFPSGINQTMHTHPSMRVGIVARGSGNCITPFGNKKLYTGQVFVIHQETGKKTIGIDGKNYLNGSHCFQTFDKEMDVIAYHPDSDFGPEHEEHPMINMTIVDGISAKHIDKIRTKVK